MTLRFHVVATLVRKDAARLLRNGPALMLLGLFVVVAILAGSSGIVEDEETAVSATAAGPELLVVYWQDGAWVEHLKRRAPRELGVRFVDASGADTVNYPPNASAIELRPPVFDKSREQLRQNVRYRHPGSDPTVLWPLTRWFLSASVEHFGGVPPFFETTQPLEPPSRADATRAALEQVSVADVLSFALIGTALLTTILFFGACGLLVSLTAQERERGALRALLLTPATYFEFVVAKGVVHGGLALATSGLAMAALRPAVLSSPLFWGTVVVSTCGYFGVGLLIASFARTQAAPNLLSFAYLLMIGAINLLGTRLEAFEFLSALTFERYGLVFMLASLNNPDVDVWTSLGVMLSPGFLTFAMLSSGLLLIATFVGSRRLRRA